MSYDIEVDAYRVMNFIYLHTSIDVQMVCLKRPNISNQMVVNLCVYVRPKILEWYKDFQPSPPPPLFVFSFWICLFF